MSEATFDNIKNTLLKVVEEKHGIDNIYIFLHIFSQIAINVMDNDFSLESIKKITLPDGEPAFNNESANEVHTILKENGETIKNTLALIKHDMEHVNGRTGSGQTGGGPIAIDRERILQALQTVREKADMDFFSVDGLYFKITNFMDKLDEQNRILSREMGVTKFIDSAPEDPTARIPTPAGVPIIVKVSMRIFPVLINGIIEILRLLIAMNKIPLPGFVGTTLGFAQGALDVARGRWKYGILSILGTMGTEMYFITLILKLIRDVWTLIEPQLADQLRYHIYMSGKSIMIGFYLRVFSIFAPDFIRKQFDEMLKPVNELYERLNEKLEEYEEEANKVANPEGMIVRFPRIGENDKVTLDDVQSLQTILSIPEVACSQEVQGIVQGSRVIPPLRFLFEMMNIPIAEGAVQMRCRGVTTETLSSKLVDMIQPEITLIPGGEMDLEERREETIAATSDIPGAAGIVGDMGAKVKAHEESIEPKDSMSIPSLGNITGKLKESASGKLAGKLGVSKIPTSLADANGKATGAVSSKLGSKIPGARGLLK
jgi:hypothetical protein